MDDKQRLTPADLDKLVALANDASEDWFIESMKIRCNQGTVAVIPSPRTEGVFQCQENLAYIAAANPAVVLSLVREIKVLRRALEEAAKDRAGSVDSLVEDYVIGWLKRAEAQIAKEEG